MYILLNCCYALVFIVKMLEQGDDTVNLSHFDLFPMSFSLVAIEQLQQTYA